MIKFRRRWYTVADCRDTPEAWFVFGDNTQRYGKGGQAIIRDEVNSLGVCTKWEPSNEDDSFFNESVHSPYELISIVAADLAMVDRKLREGDTVFWPWDNIGTGRANLPKSAPITYDFICRSVHYMIQWPVYGELPSWVFLKDER